MPRISNSGSVYLFRSVFLRFTFLGLAFIWAIAVFVILARYHTPEPRGMTSITTNGHTYYGNPPELTLRQRDPVSFVIILTVMGVGFVVAAINLVTCHLRQSSGIALGAVVGGVLVILVSFFGLFAGVLTVGIDGVLLVLSGQTYRSVDVS